MTKENLKIVFFGTPEFAVTSLERLVDNGFNIAAVVTMPDKQAGRGHHLIQSDVKKYAVDKGLPVLQPEKLKDEAFIQTLREIDADLFIVIAFRMLPEVVWNMPRLGTFNLHASLLPKYRGAAPINWAVINGDTHTGVTTFFLKHEIDTGDIIQQKSIPIEITDNVGVVHDKLMVLGAEMVLQTVEGIINDSVCRTPQDEMLNGEEPCQAPKIFKDTCHIDWTKPAMTVYNHIRGLSPYPAAWTEIDKDGSMLQLKIYATSLPINKSNCIPGRASVADGKLIVDCNDGCIEVLSVQLQGKRRMDTADFLRGFSIDGATLK